MYLFEKDSFCVYPLSLPGVGHKRWSCSMTHTAGWCGSNKVDWIRWIQRADSESSPAETFHTSSWYLPNLVCTFHYLHPKEGRSSYAFAFSRSAWDLEILENARSVRFALADSRLICWQHRKTSFFSLAQQKDLEIALPSARFAAESGTRIIGFPNFWAKSTTTSFQLVPNESALDRILQIVRRFSLRLTL